MSVIISIDAEGDLAMTIPHEHGETTVKLKPGYEAEAMTKVLRAQAAGVRRVTGTLAAPTQAELVHNAQHGMFPDEKCAFCKALARQAERSSNRTPRRMPIILAEHGGVVVRRIQAKSNKIKRDVTLEMIGL